MTQKKRVSPNAGTAFSFTTTAPPLVQRSQPTSSSATRRHMQGGDTRPQNWSCMVMQCHVWPGPDVGAASPLCPCDPVHGCCNLSRFHPLIGRQQSRRTMTSVSAHQCCRPAAAASPPGSLCMHMLAVLLSSVHDRGSWSVAAVTRYCLHELVLSHNTQTSLQWSLLVSRSAIQKQLNSEILRYGDF